MVRRKIEEVVWLPNNSKEENMQLVIVTYSSRL